MTKNDFCKLYAEKAGIAQKKAVECVDIFRDTLEEALAQDGVVRLNNFISFEVKEVPERECRNPRTGETVQVSARNKIKVKVSDCFTSKLQ